MAALMPQQATSAIVVALAFAPEQAGRLRIPRGFGFVVPPLPSHGEEHKLLACTFVDQKFPGRVPPGAVLLRAFFGGHSGRSAAGRSGRFDHRARPLAVEPGSGSIAASCGNGGAPLAPVAAAIRRRPPGTHGGAGIVAERNARSASGGQRLSRSGIAGSDPRGSSHRATARRAAGRIRIRRTAPRFKFGRSNKKPAKFRPGWNRLVGAVAQRDKL